MPAQQHFEIRRDTGQHEEQRTSSSRTPRSLTRRRRPVGRRLRTVLGSFGELDPGFPTGQPDAQPDDRSGDQAHDGHKYARKVVRCLDVAAAGSGVRAEDRSDNQARRRLPP